MSKASPLELKLGIPETVKEIREFLVEALELARDWKYHKQKRQIDLEKDRLALAGIKMELAFQRDTNKIKLARLRQELEGHMPLDVITGEQASPPTLQGQAPKLLEENAQPSVNAEPITDNTDAVGESTIGDIGTPSDTKASRQPRARTSESAFIQLRRDIGKIAVSPNDIVSVDPLDD